MNDKTESIPLERLELYKTNNEGRVTTLDTIIRDKTTEKEDKKSDDAYNRSLVIFYFTSLTSDITCAMISCVEIEKTCPFVRTGKGHKGLREISTVKNISLPYKFYYEEEFRMNIYVGNLPREANEDDLRQAFEAYGQVASAKIITDKFTGASRGFGFVEMPNSPEAQSAINGLDGTDLKGRALKVNEARPRSEDRRGRGGGGFGRGGFGGRKRF